MKIEKYVFVSLEEDNMESAADDTEPKHFCYHPADSSTLN